MLIFQNKIIEAITLQQYLHDLAKLIDENNNFEAAFHQLGLKNINNVNQKYNKNELIEIYGKSYKSQRFHYLVRAGGDILKTNIALSKPTLLGGMIYLNNLYNNPP